jgi:transcriptional regulator with XRE-family HTH domain
VQDAAVGQILAGLKAKRFTRKQLKDRTGWGSERLSRYMTGQVPIQLDDLMLLLDAAGIPFASVAWVSTEEQFRERQRLTDIQGYLAGLQQQVGVELAQVHQARDQSLSSSSPPTVRGLPRVR